MTARQRDYYARNRDKVAVYQRDYYARNRDKVAVYQRDYYARNRDKVAIEIKCARGGNVCWGCGEEMTRLPADGLCGACRAERCGRPEARA